MGSRRLVCLGFLLTGFGGPGPAASQEVPSRTLEMEAGQVAESWENGDSSGLVEMMASSGIRLHILEEAHFSISRRQARASVDDFLARYQGGEALVTRVYRGGGEGGTGFAEIRWRTRSVGTTEPVTFTIFVGFVLTEEFWVISEIRVLT